MNRSRHAILTPLAVAGLLTGGTWAAPPDADDARRLDLIGLGDVNVLLDVTIPTDPDELLDELDPAAFLDRIEAEAQHQLQVAFDDGDIDAADETSGHAALFTIDADWNAPFGADWLRIDAPTIVAAYEDDGTFDVAVIGSFDFGMSTVDAAIEFDADGHGTIVGAVDWIDLGDLRDVAAWAGLTPPLDDTLADDALVLRDVVVSMHAGDDRSLTVRGGTTLFGELEVDAMVSIVEDANATRQMIVGFKAAEWTLAHAFRGMNGTLVGKITFPEVAFTVAQDISNAEVPDSMPTITMDDLDPAALDYYASVVGDKLEGLDFESGLNLDAALPLSQLPTSLVRTLGLDPREELVLDGAIDATIAPFAKGERLKVNHLRFEADLPPSFAPGTPAWLLESRTIQRKLVFVYRGGTWRIRIRHDVEAFIDGGWRTFELSSRVSTDGRSAELELSGAMTSTWSQPFGIEWLTLEEVSLDVVAGNRSSSATVHAAFHLGHRRFDAEMAIAGSGGHKTFTLTAYTEALSLDDFRRLAQLEYPAAAPFDGAILDFTFTDVTMTLEAGSRNSLSLSAGTKMRGVDVDVMFAAWGSNGEPKFASGIRIDDFTLASAFPALAGTIVDDLNIALPSATFLLTNDTVRLNSSLVGPAAATFYREVTGRDDFDMVVEPGLNIVGRLPGIGGPVTTMISKLGVPADEMLLRGRLPVGFLKGGGFSLSDLELRLELPPIAPDFAPPWLIGGQLAIEITGRPSLALVGELNLDIQGDHLTFFVAGSIGRDGAGVSVALTGGLRAAEGWHSPFGVEWLTINEVVIKLAFSVTGNLTLGFSGDVVIGQKDIDVAMAIAINVVTLTPSNFMIDGSSEDGVAFSDLIQLQQAMARAAGQPANIDVSRLPDMQLRNMHFKFAPKDDPDLGIEMGFAIGGDLYARTEIGGDLRHLCGVHVDISKDGIYFAGYLGQFDAGRVKMWNCSIELVVSLSEVRLSVAGSAMVGGQVEHVDVELTPLGIAGELLGQTFEQLQAAAQEARIKMQQAMENFRNAISALPKPQWGRRRG